MDRNALSNHDKAKTISARPEEKFKKLFEFSPVGMALINHLTGEFIEVNQSLLTSVGYTKKEFLKLSFWDITPAEYRDQEIQQMKDLESKGRFGPNEKEYIRKDGSRFPIRISGFLFADADGTQLVWGIIEDISNQYRRIFNELGDAYVQIDLTYRLALVNPASIKLFGYQTTDEMIGLSVNELFIEPDELDKISAQLENNDRMLGFGCQFARKDGSSFWGSLNVQFVHDKSGKRSSIEGVIRDISDQRRSETEIRSSEAKFKAAFMTGADTFYWATLKEGRILEINDSFESFFGYTREEVIGKTSLELNLYYDPEDRARLVSELQKKGIVRSLEVKGRKKDGTIIIVSMSISKVELNHEQYVLGILRDITDQKKTQQTIVDLNQSLHKLSERMVLATRSARLGIWDWDVINNELIWDDGMYDLYHVHREDFSGAYEAWILQVYPEDKDRADKAIQSALTGEKDYDLEFRIIWPDGSIHTVHATGQVFFDHNGRPLRMVGINRDITQSKLLEQNLYDSLERNQRILNNLQDAYFQADLNGTLTLVNARAVQLYGYQSESEMLGLSATHLYADTAVRDNVLSLLKRDGQAKDFIGLAKRKDGSAFWISINAQYVKAKDGTIIGTEGVVRDITVRIADEQRIKFETERYNALIESTNDWIWIVDSQTFDLVIFNTSVANYFKKNHNIILRPGLKNDEMLSKSRSVLWRELYTRAVKEGRFTMEYETASDGLKFQLSLAPVIIDQATVGVSVFANDITKEVKYKEDLVAINTELSKRLEQTINAISKIGEMRDVYTAGHQRRVAELACAIAKEMNLSADVINNIYLGALIHDIGKINIASDILNKPGKISNLEYQLLQTHVDQSYNIVKEIDFPAQISLMIYQHHEHMDGSGYPKGLVGNEILLESRILVVADVVEAMSSHRPYRPALGTEKALEEILTYKGKKYDSAVVDACVNVFRKNGFIFTKFI